MEVSVIIPSLDGDRGGNLQSLKKQLQNQTFNDFEIIVVKGTTPCSKAHNVGVNEANGDFIVFFDDDIQLDNDSIIENLIKVLTEDSEVGIIGASQLIPPDSNRFQKRCALELYRTQAPIFNEIVETDMATHAAMAMRKSVYEEVGGENENLLRNDDVYLRYKIKNAGYKIVIAPNTWVYHHMPKNLLSLIRSKFIHGLGIAHDYKYFPEYIYFSPIDNNELVYPDQSNLWKQIQRNVKILILGLQSLYMIRILARVCTYSGIAFGLFLTKNWFTNRQNKSKKRRGEIQKYFKNDPAIAQKDISLTY